MKTIKNNLITIIINGRLSRRGDGAPIVRLVNGRGVVKNQFVRTLISKAGSYAKRGSEVTILQNRSGVETYPINIKAISNMKNLVVAYETIKSNPGNMTQD